MYLWIYRIQQLIFSRTMCALGDSLAYHLGQKFSTRDHDNDAMSSGSCAVLCKGGWWYSWCHHSNLNGVYKRGAYSSPYAVGVAWKYWKGTRYSLRFTEMKIRPFDYWRAIDTKTVALDFWYLEACSKFIWHRVRYREHNMSNVLCG